MLYAVGGFDGDRRLASVERYNPETDVWVEVASLNRPRSGAADAKRRRSTGLSLPGPHASFAPFASGIHLPFVDMSRLALWTPALTLRL
ncbi:unnamed protein product [Dibothriocephalus latus]|uniref:Kelch repeat protein n=1 Tax=Dibothriocephalus latus TaxID=60516 RepID=A0A3P7PMR8_DIBLA|nr:unnamed protein product [Dibothriocephalus latus]